MLQGKVGGCNWSIYEEGGRYGGIRAATWC